MDLVRTMIENNSCGEDQVHGEERDTIHASSPSQPCRAVGQDLTFSHLCSTRRLDSLLWHDRICIEADSPAGHPHQLWLLLQDLS